VVVVMKKNMRETTAVEAVAAMIPRTMAVMELVMVATREQSRNETSLVSSQSKRI
ncbi:hypothetical protein K7432_017971, partial [Basidiobolus ranarum]